MRLISIGRIYLLKSSEAERCILPDDAHRKPPARANRAKTAPKSNSAQSGHLADQQKTTHMFQYCSAKVPLRFSASKAPPRRRPLAFAHVQNALSHLPVSLQACMHPKRLSCSPEPRALLCACPKPKRPLSLPAPKASSCPPESKAALRSCLNPRLPFTIARTQSPHVHPDPKIPLVSARV